jgi:hypothetical protein
MLSLLLDAAALATGAAIGFLTFTSAFWGNTETVVAVAAVKGMAVTAIGVATARLARDPLWRRYLRLTMFEMPALFMVQWALLNLLATGHPGFDLGFWLFSPTVDFAIWLVVNSALDRQGFRPDWRAGLAFAGLLLLAAGSHYYAELNPPPPP